jgi:pimeloyl-ACP methyl ester carboxylesterase
MPAYREGTVSAQDGLLLYYRDYGDRLSARTPMLCLSGLTRNSADFATLAERLSGERRVICPDYRGRGRSAYDRDWRHYDPYVYISDVSHLLTATGVDRAVIVGTSMGGLLALGLAVLRPTLVAGVVLNDIGPDVASPGLGRILQYVGVDYPQSDWDAAIRFLKDLTPNLAPKADDTWWRAHAEATYRKGADGRLHFDWDVALAKPLDQQRKATPDLWTMFRGLKPIRTLAFRGALSDVLSEDVFRRMALEKPDLVCVTVPDTGHTPSLTEPQATSALDAFLQPL